MLDVAVSLETGDIPMPKTTPKLRTKPLPIPAPKTAGYIKRLASEGLKRPSALRAIQVQELAASVMSHIEPRANNTTVLACKLTSKATGRKKR
jgi:hypothetical protein